MVCLLALGCTSCTRYACGVPEADGKCRPLNAVYRALTGDPGTFSRQPSHTALETTADAASPGERETGPQLAQPRQLRVWVPSWIDAEGDLHGESYLYLRLDEGRWLLGP